MVEQLPEYRIIGSTFPGAELETDINTLAGDGYEVVNLTVTARPEGHYWYTCLLRLRHDDPAEPTEQGDLASGWQKWTDHHLQLRHIRAHDQVQIEVERAHARLDGFSEQQGRSERILCDRVAAQAELFATEVAKLVARVQKQENTSGEHEGMLEWFRSIHADAHAEIGKRLAKLERNLSE